VNRAAAVAFGVTAVFGALVTLVVWPNAALISKAYTDNPQTLAMAIPALVLASAMFLPDAVQVVVAQSLRARGDVWLPTYTHLTSYIVVMAPLAWWLAIPLHMGVMGIAAAVVVASVVSGVLLLARFWILARRPL
jgi:multidrug resistance protein, MATE family